MLAPLTTIILLLSVLFASAQNMRYFQFSVACGHGNWQDTAFVAATNDTALINTVLAEMAKPMEERMFINGPIAAGHAGYNRNATHWFKWHFVPNEWSLVEFAIEVCDGCPFTDTDFR